MVSHADMKADKICQLLSILIYQRAVNANPTSCHLV